MSKLDEEFENESTFYPENWERKYKKMGHDKFKQYLHFVGRKVNRREYKNEKKTPPNRSPNF